jgi:hypothetical protein
MSTALALNNLHIPKMGVPERQLGMPQFILFFFVLSKGYETPSAKQEQRFCE